MKPEIRSLEDASPQDVHQCFLEAFSDYLLDIRMPEAAFHEMNALRAVRYDLSVGAYSGQRMVGLTLNAGDVWNGKPTAYDAGTGVVPSHRSQGLSRRIMEQSMERLKALGFEAYLLEVITRNEKALKLYQSLGFQITRRLECLVLKSPLPPPIDDSKQPLVDVESHDFPRLEAAMSEEIRYGFQPSWQNSWNTIRRRPDLYRVVAAWDQEQCLGYGAIGAGRGGIAQLWVRRASRRQGLGSQILRALVSRSPDQKVYSWVNVDERADHTLNFLKAMGFTEQLAQFEMEKDLRPARARNPSHPG